MDADELWARSDVLTIHLSRNKTTIGMYDGEVLDKMKTGAFLINCARGNMVDEHALKERLESGHISGAAFDVFAVEPANGNPLLDVPNFFGSPHIGATTRESWGAMLRSGMHGIKDAYSRSPAFIRSTERPGRCLLCLAAYAGRCRFRKVRARLMVRAFSSGGSFQGNTVISAFGASEAMSIET